jgi:Cysteine dioxygenase type I
MAFAYPGSTADLRPARSPHRVDGLAVGPGAPLPPTRRPDPRRQPDLLAIAEGFAGTAMAIPELRSGSDRSWVLLAVSDLFEAWAIGWPAGGRIELHDHGHSHGAVVVAGGSLTETTVRATTRGVTLIGTRHIGEGEHRIFGPDFVHDLGNDRDDVAVSVHVYGPRLTSMQYYELDGQGRLVATRAETVPPVGPFDVTSDHDPS